jgi:hypothetical protein
MGDIPSQFAMALATFTITAMLIEAPYEVSIGLLVTHDLRPLVNFVEAADQKPFKQIS